MTYYLHVTADSNDGDYVYSLKEISGEDYRKLEPVFEAIKNFKPYKTEWGDCHHNFAIGDCLRQDMGELPLEKIYPDVDPDALDLFVQEYAPCSEGGIHSIKSISVYEVTDATIIL